MTTMKVKRYAENPFCMYYSLLVKYHRILIYVLSLLQGNETLDRDDEVTSLLISLKPIALYDTFRVNYRNRLCGVVDLRVIIPCR